MFKKCLILLIIMFVFLTGCGKITKQLSDISPEDTAGSSVTSPDQETLTQSEMATFVQALRTSVEIMGAQANSTETDVSTEPFQVSRTSSSFSTLGVSDGYQYWNYKTSTRVVNGITETVQWQYRYYTTSGELFNHAYTSGAFGYIERYLDITSSKYEAHFHEKITYSGQIATIKIFPGSTYTNQMVFNDLTMTVGTRTITYDPNTKSGNGTISLTYGTMSGAMAITIVNDVYSMDGYLYKSGKKAVHLVIQNNNQTTMTYLVNKTDAANYYYAELNLLSSDLVSNVCVEIMDSGTYTTQLLLYRVANVTINVTSGQTPWFNSTSSYILRINDCDNIYVSGLNFENTANTSTYYYVNLSASSYVTLTNCKFQKSTNKNSTFVLVQTSDHVNIKNSIFSYINGNKKSTGINIYTSGIDANVVLQNNTFSGLNYGVYFLVGLTSNPSVTITGNTFQNNQYGIYRTLTGYTFINTNNTFSGNNTNIR